MTPFDCLLAVALLTAPPETVDPVQTPEAYAGIRPVMQRLALQWEILDPQELPYLLVRPEDFFSDLNLLRRRYEELADAPPLSDAQRFPAIETITEYLTRNRAFKQTLEIRSSCDLHKSWEARATIQETDHLYQIWDSVRDARCEYFYISVRRQALKRVRDTVGPATYYAGKLPPAVPLWRFEVRD